LQKFVVVVEQILHLEIHGRLVGVGLVVRVWVLLLVHIHAFADFEQVEQTVADALGGGGD